jgi:hypothetical protein
MDESKFMSDADQYFDHFYLIKRLIKNFDTFICDTDYHNREKNGRKDDKYKIIYDEYSKALYDLNVYLRFLILLRNKFYVWCCYDEPEPCDDSYHFELR